MKKSIAKIFNLQYNKFFLLIVVIFTALTIGYSKQIAIKNIKSGDKIQLKLYVFESGIMRLSDMSMFDSDFKKGTVGKSSNMCYLIQHPKGNLMWDTGMPDSISEKKDGVVAVPGVIHWFVPKTLKSQLNEIKIDPLKITYLAFSHFHSDHTGNSSYFKNSTLLVQEIEYNLAFSPTAVRYGFDPRSYSDLKKQPVIKLNGNYDVFDDGSVVIISAPGHSPGHQVLFVNLPKSGPVILAGDLYLSQKLRNKQIADLKKSDKGKNSNYIENLVIQTKAKLWINHDKEQNDNIKLAPAFYE